MVEKDETEIKLNYYFFHFARFNPIVSKNVTIQKKKNQIVLNTSNLIHSAYFFYHISKIFIHSDCRHISKCSINGMVEASFFFFNNQINCITFNFLFHVQNLICILFI